MRTRAVDKPARPRSFPYLPPQFPFTAWWHRLQMPTRRFAAPLTPKGRRADARVRLCIPARLILLGGTRACQLDDLSCAGARLAMTKPPAPGESGVMVVNGIEAFGMVVWSAGDRCGILFDEKLAMDHVVRLRHFADHYADEHQLALERNARTFVLGRHA